MKSNLYCIALIVAASVGVTLGLSGCDRFAGDSTASAEKPAARSAAQLPPDLFVATAPADAVDVAAAKRSSLTDSDIVIRGRIGGRVEPFVAGRAMFMLADASMPTCTETHGDGCPTPWDYCCEPADRVLASTATIQVVDADGRPLKADLNGVGGLRPTAEVIVTGSVSTQEEGGALVVDARGIYVKPD